MQQALHQALQKAFHQTGVDFGTVNITPILHGVVATILYFLVGAAVLIAGFLMVDVLTPGNLRRLVFIDRRPNAVVLASAMYAALAIVIITAIHTSSSQLGQGLVDVAVYGGIGVALQGRHWSFSRLPFPVASASTSRNRHYIRRHSPRR
ncbi:hypothetical protein NIIDMKKI_44600 [Mycobacterium kansasii]|uniref:Uncharacterized protein n=1 Tax=Mycobacterium kansasii TaxID=1768 RepID=A0A7G1IFQ0_MYCKA|nr:hypothetical protein NIIDMKKI_44600 [Mycobacterium kansasii]